MTLKYKKYDDYEKYIEDQISKFVKKYDKIAATSELKRASFTSRFELYTTHLPKSPVLCLGARLGEEVQVFRKLGFSESIGTDLCITEDNDLVIKCDWNNLPFEDNSYKIIYTNSIDHVSNINSFHAEISRVLLDDGYLILELLKKHTLDDNKINERFADDSKHESMLWNTEKDVLDVFENFDILYHSCIAKWNVYIFKKNY